MTITGADEMNKTEEVRTYHEIHATLHFTTCESGTVLTSPNGHTWTECSRDFYNGALAASNGIHRHTLKVGGEFKWFKRIYHKLRGE